MVESTRLESERTGNRTVGSNPTLSAIPTIHLCLLGLVSVMACALHWFPLNYGRKEPHGDFETWHRLWQQNRIIILKKANEGGRAHRPTEACFRRPHPSSSGTTREEASHNLRGRASLQGIIAGPEAKSVCAGPKLCTYTLPAFPVVCTVRPQLA